MPAINKPGVYITETLTPTAPSVQGAGDSVAVFIGVSDRGPTTGSGSNVVSVAAAVNNFSEFQTQFSYSVVSPFDTAATVASASSQAYNNTVGTSSLQLKYAVKSYFDNGGGQAIIVRDVKRDAVQAVASFKDNQQSITAAPTNQLAVVTATSASSATTLLVSTTAGIVANQVVAGTNVNSTALVSTITSTPLSAINTNSASSNSTTLTIATGTAVIGQTVTGTTSIPVGTYITAIGSGNVTLSATTSSAITNAAIVFTTNTLTVTQGNSGSVAAGSALNFGGWTFEYPSTTTAKVVVSSSLGVAEFSNLEAGRLVSFSGITGAYSALSVAGKRWIITDVDPAGKSFCIYYKNAATIGSAVVGGSSIKINGGTASAATLDIVAKDHGIWGNNIWVSVTPGSVENTFDLNVYYTLDQSKNSASLVTDNDRVETFTGLSMNSADPRYAPKYVNGNSAWITLTDKVSGATGYDDLPLFTTLWSYATNAANVKSTDYSFNWDASGVVSSLATSTYNAVSGSVTSAGATAVNKVRVGTTATTKSTLAGTAGSEGSISADLGTVGGFTATDILPRLDNFIQPLLINYPDAVNLNSANNGTAITKILNYAANRADSFVIIDPISADVTPANVIQNTLSQYASNINYGAAYFPNIKITDPASPIPTATVSVPPGGAVAAEYVSTDTSRGVFKAPAGIYTEIGNAKDVTYAMNASDFDTVNSAKYALNIIRPIPGSGICIMGARTLSSVYADKYVPTRRSLNYIGANLRSLTQFAVFEPNDQNLWSDVNAVVTNFLDSFWRAGGLLGATSDQAYYVKCDATTNTTAAIAAGELRVEVGVALQRPAEFIIIKLGQINGGATITTSS
jgi:phage tail sheath protein FI